MKTPPLLKNLHTFYFRGRKFVSFMPLNSVRFAYLPRFCDRRVLVIKKKEKNIHVWRILIPHILLDGQTFLDEIQSVGRIYLYTE